MQQILNNPYDLVEINSFLHSASKEEIINTYNKYKEEWINKGIITYYAEDFIKYQNSLKLDNSLEPYILYIIYNALNYDKNFNKRNV